MRNALSIAAGASSVISVPKMLLIDRLKLISPRPIVTGNISLSTRITRSSRQLNERVSRKPGSAQPRQRQQELDDGPDQDADRVGVDAVVALELRRQDDQRRDDREVPEQRRDRTRPEVVEAVEDPDDQAR